MTYAQLVNAVLRRLREDEVSVYDETDYSKLIGDFINEVKQKVEDAWDWSMLRQTITFTTVASTNTYDMDGVTSDVAMGERFKIFNIIDDTNDNEIYKVDYRWLKKHNLLGTQQTAAPWRYMLESATNGNPTLQLYPIPDGAYSIKVHAKVPQADFDSDSDTLKVPSLPVILGAYTKALMERGDDGSTNNWEEDPSFKMALADAVALDVLNYPSESSWDVI